MRGLAGSPVLRRLAFGSAALVVVTAAMAGIAAAVGPFAMPPSHAMSAILDFAGLMESPATATERAVVETIRLPRIVLALLVGGALGVSGAVMQGLFRNPMADPGIIGVSTGGAVGAVVAIAIGANAAFPLALPAMAFAGAAGALALVYAVASAGGRFSMAALLLTGVAVAAFLAAVISAIVLYTEDREAQRAMIFWLAGGLDASRWEDVRLAAPFVLAGAAVAVILARDLNLLMVSEEEARALGVRVGFTRNLPTCGGVPHHRDCGGVFGHDRFRGAGSATCAAARHGRRSPRSHPAERARRRPVPVSCRHAGACGGCPGRGAGGHRHFLRGRAVLSVSTGTSQVARWVDLAIVRAAQIGDSDRMITKSSMPAAAGGQGYVSGVGERMHASELRAALPNCPRPTPTGAHKRRPYDGARLRRLFSYQPSMSAGSGGSGYESGVGQRMASSELRSALPDCPRPTPMGAHKRRPYKWTRRRGLFSYQFQSD